MSDFLMKQQVQILQSEYHITNIDQFIHAFYIVFLVAKMPTSLSYFILMELVFQNTNSKFFPQIWGVKWIIENKYSYVKLYEVYIWGSQYLFTTVMLMIMKFSLAGFWYNDHVSWLGNSHGSLKEISGEVPSLKLTVHPWK